MTSVECYNFGMSLQNQPASGNVPVPTFQDFLNRAQVEYLNELSGDGTDASLMQQKSLSPFFRNIPVPLTNGIGTYNINDSVAFGPTLWASGYNNPACGETSTEESTLTPVLILESAGWADRTQNLVDTTSSSYPVARVLDGTRIEVRPKTMSFVFAWYIRYPRKIVIGSLVDPSGIPRPTEGAPNQVDPEWSDIDMIKIIWRAMGYTGLALQSNRMQSTAQIKEKV